MSKKVKVAAPVISPDMVKEGESAAIKGVLYIQPNGDQFFEADENHPKNPSKQNGYKLLFSDGVVKHYTTAHRHVLYISLDKKTTELLGSILPRMVVRFCASASAKKIKYYVKTEGND